MSSPSDIEIEIKLPLLGISETKGFLERSATPKSKDVYQKDSYFVPKHRDFLGVRYPYEWLRLRDSPKGASITYKHFYPENAEKTDYCDEFETKIESFDAMAKIFRSLDLKEAVTVEKTRSIWMYKEVEIAIDDVTGLGAFIELELKGAFESPAKGKEYLYEILKEISATVGEEDLRGYPFRMLEQNGYRFEE